MAVRSTSPDNYAGHSIRVTVHNSRESHGSVARHQPTVYYPADYHYPTRRDSTTTDLVDAAGRYYTTYHNYYDSRSAVRNDVNIIDATPRVIIEHSRTSSPRKARHGHRHSRNRDYGVRYYY